jgi:topoisomerase-4 subunit A
VAVRSLEDDWIVAVTSVGNMLVIPLADLPEMAKGKGNKIINIPGAKLKSGEECVVAMTLVQEGEKLTIVSGQRHKTMPGAEVDEYAGERGQRGFKLPRGFRKVDALYPEWRQSYE